MRLYQYIAIALLVALLAACSQSAATTGTSPATPTQTADPAITTVVTSAVPTTSSPAPDPTETPAAVTSTPDTPTQAALDGAPATAFPEPPERNLYKLASELKGADLEEVDRVVNPAPVSYAAGRQDTFWLVDIVDLEVYPSRFLLRLVTPNAYWYFEEGLSVPQSTLERTAARFETEIYPRVTGAFGSEWKPGVDNDPHLTILNARLTGVGGYYNSSDQYPSSVREFSNEREMIYMNAEAVPVDSPRYLGVLAHELQHAVQWNADPSEESWVSEGLAEVGVTVAGFGHSSVYRFLRSPPTSVVQWPLSPVGSLANYGGASLFMHYLLDQYGDFNDVRPLLAEQADGIAGVDAYLQSAGYDATFMDVFRDFAAANVLDEDHGPYGYSTLDVEVLRSRPVADFSDFSSRIPQYAVEYVTLNTFEEPLEIQFNAPTENRLLPVDVGSRGCWWSNMGDSISSTLTKPLDLTSLDQATLDYQIWFEVEEDWDYGYLQVSADGGRSWDILQAPHTTAENPIGNSYGMGYTGQSRDWIDESVDLTGYAGQEVLLRFHYVTDAAVHGSGMCLRNVSIPELGPSMEDDEWTAEGFVWTDNRVKQDYIVQVIQVGQSNRVTRMQLDESNSGSVVIAAPQEWDRLVVAVAAAAPKTRQEAEYTLAIRPMN